MELYPLRWLVENELPERDLVNPYDRGKQEHIFSLLSRRLGCCSKSHFTGQSIEVRKNIYYWLFP